MELDNTTQVPAQTAETSQTAEAVQADPKLGSTQDQSRREVYAKLYGGQETAVGTGTQEQTTESPAQGEQTLETSQEQVAAPPPDERDVRLAKMEEAVGQIATFLSQMSHGGQQQPAAQATGTATQAATPGAWLELLRQGKIAEFEEALANTIAAKFVPQAKSEATTEALDLFRIETELTSYVDDLRRKNPDLMPLEDTIAAKAKVRLEAAQASGKIRSADEYIKAYKNAVEQSVGEARSIIQTIRAAGKEDANTRNREVLSSSTVAPGAVKQVDRTNIPVKTGPVAETPEDYIAKRRAFQNRSSGLAG